MSQRSKPADPQARPLPVHAPAMPTWHEQESARGAGQLASTPLPAAQEQAMRDGEAAAGATQLLYARYSEINARSAGEGSFGSVQPQAPSARVGQQGWQGLAAPGGVLASPSLGAGAYLRPPAPPDGAVQDWASSSQAWHAPGSLAHRAALTLVSLLLFALLSAHSHHQPRARAHALTPRCLCCAPGVRMHAACQPGGGHNAGEGKRAEPAD
jgi:hypothetical protein